MEMPGTTELFTIFAIIIVFFGPTYYLSKRKNLSLGWNLLWTMIFGPLWWIVLLLRKTKQV